MLHDAAKVWTVTSIFEKLEFAPWSCHGLSSWSRHAGTLRCSAWCEARELFLGSGCRV